ncbi:amino acid adenylation domain-containing protein [Micromonospora sp. NBC_01699]|uniref:non-ribosomal peptide synthetase n=1 Tax=Micromonospora sp. NBC_01699 TaxID=2975984 RepID=UPI002E299CDC|nr:non-ribosomal peptide synthetase [Micromonospora sp. NBC_01699]
MPAALPERFPLTAYQLDIWVAAARAEESPQYNTSLHERLEGDVDPATLVACTEAAVRRNEALRIRFGDEDGTPFQWVADRGPAVELVDLSGTRDPEAACRDRLTEEQLRPFPLRGGPVGRILVLVENPRVVHLYMVLHHLITDGWSHNELGHQIFRDYAAATQGRPSAENNPPSYRSFVAEEAAYRASAAADDDRDAHLAALADATPVLFPRRAAPEPRRGARYSFSIEGSWVRRVRAAGLPVFPYIAAMVGTYLCRVHRSDEVVLGIPLLNRPQEYLRTAGQFANTLPLRVAPGSEPTVLDLAARLRAAITVLREHERAPLGDVLRALPTLTGRSRQLFDVQLSYLRVTRPKDTPELSRRTSMRSPCHEQDALSIVVLAFDDTDEIRFDLEYAPDVFDEDQPIESVGRHLSSLLRNGVALADQPAPAVPMLSPAERDQLIARGRGERVRHPDRVTVPELFEARVARHPDRIALVGPEPGQALTYGQLDARANQVARGLRADGVGVGDRVAVLVERGPDLLAALLGILKAGAAYVPVDPGYPAERIRFLLDDSRPAAVLVSGRGQPDIAGPPVHRVTDLLHGDSRALATTATATDVAYVIYTSGSTGRPKGVRVSHRSVVNRLAWMQRRYPLGRDDTLLQKTPVSFDVSVWELFWWAVEGASLALLPPGGEKDPRVIRQAVRDHRVTVAHFVPSMLGPFLDTVPATGTAPDGGTLRLVFCSGEALPAARVDQFNRLLHTDGRTVPTLVNLYGPTETTVDVTFHDCPADPSVPVGRVPIGRPVDNTDLYVIGPDGALQPDGLPGELYVGGVQVALGYLDRPELTAERFVPDRFTGNGRLYRTGDLVRWLTDGSLEYLGRLDDQVKIRGNRVELGEVTGALLAVPGVRDALVVDRASGARGTHLVGYYVPATDATAADVRRHLARTLPDFMVPTHLVPIDRIPLTPNGKADRRALPAPETDAPARASRPLTPTEALLADIWSGVLGRGPIAADDDFFALGGDSLLMLRVRALAERRGVGFSLADLMRHPTLAGLAAHAGGDGGPGDEAPHPFALVAGVDRARLADARDAYPLTRMQLGLIYHSRRHETSAVYKDVFHYTLSLDWEEAPFRDAFARLTARHPALRTTFHLAGLSEPLQVVHPTVPDRLDVLDLRGRPRNEGDAEVRRHVEERRFHDYAFDRVPPYLFRVHVRESEIDLVLSFHHALLDGASVALVVAELLHDYAHALGRHPHPVPDTPLPSPAAYVHAERLALDSAASRRYWSRQLAAAQSLTLPGFRPHEPRTATTGAAVTHRADLPPGLTERLRAFAQDHLLPVKSVLFAAHCLMLRLFSGGTDVITGLITHGRPELAGAERIIGLFLNTLPLRVNTASNTWIGVAREAFGREQDAYPHRRYPLSAIQEDLGGTIAETAFNYVHLPQLTEAGQLPGVKLTEMRTAEETNFTLLVNVVTDPIDQHLWLRLDGDGRVVTDAQLRQFADYYARVLDRMLRYPDEPPGWDFLTEPAPVQTTGEQTEPTAYSVGEHTGPTVVERFAEQAARTPETVAVATATQRWSYAHLAATSAAVADGLRDRGITPGAVVGVALDRSPELIAVILGIVRAGATVMPLDTGYPAARLADMIEQAEPAHIVTTARHDTLFGRPERLVRPEQLTAARPAGNRAAPSADPEGIAYLLFTSGSTGRPKGVAMPHRSLANLVSWQNRIASAASGVTLQYAPLSFDVSFQEIFSTLCAGGTLRLVDEETRRDMPALLRLLDRERVERVFLPYIALQQVAVTSDALGIVPRGLRVIVSSGEQLRITEEIRRLCAALPGVLLENQYGPTETHVVTHQMLSGPPADHPELPPIGTAIDGVRVHVLDARLRPVPAGVTGELYVSGVCLARGYLGRDDLTGERFLTGPHPYGRLYRTGDLGFTLPDGAIVCTGRADTQVKVRGYRVETAEVELAIGGLAAEYPGIREAAVVARVRPGGDAFLAAFLTGDPSTVDSDAVVSRLREALPEYMVPGHVEWLATLPSTPSGKRDDAALRSLPLTAPGTAGDNTSPRTEPERILADILADLLRLPAVGIHDDIFALGGTSLTAMRLVVTIEQRFGTRIPLSEFVAAPTVAALAVRLGVRRAEVAPFHPLVPVKASGTRPPLFLVHPMGGNVLCYLPLARRLPSDQPLYALQAAGADPGTEPLRTVAALAADYLEAIRTVQPHGPYTVGGWSFGGFVAFEMARQLRAAGERVDRLILLDTVALNPLLRERYTDEALLGWFFWELLWTERGGTSPLQDIPDGLTSLDDKFAYIARCAADRGVLPADSSHAVIRRLFEVYRTNWDATLAYRPHAVDQDLTLLRAHDPLPKVLEAMHGAAGSLHQDPTNGWHGMTDGRIEVVGVPGDHLSMMEEPGVAQLADTIAALLRPTEEPPYQDTLHPSAHSGPTR